MKYRMVIIVTATFLCLNCVSTQPVTETKSVTIGIDASHKTNLGNTLIQDLEKMGLSVVYFDDEITAERLSLCDALLTLAPRSEYSEKERVAMAEWIKGGKRLICAGQAWSWTMPDYDNKPLDRYPLNILGSDLGFQITDENIGRPKNFNNVLLHTSEIVQKDWWPSRIELRAADYIVLIRDESGKLMAGSLSFGIGKVFVFGAESLLHQNPNLIVYCCGR